MNAVLQQAPIQWAGWAAIALLVAVELRQLATDRKIRREWAEWVETNDPMIDAAHQRLDLIGAPGVHDDPETAPISLLDRPTPAQLVAPTVPDLEAQHPAPNADSYGRHASVGEAA